MINDASVIHLASVEHLPPNRFDLLTEDDRRSPDVVADTVLKVLARDPAESTANAVYDEDSLREAGFEDVSAYNLTEGEPAPMSVQMFDLDYERPE